MSRATVFMVGANSGVSVTGLSPFVEVFSVNPVGTVVTVVAFGSGTELGGGDYFFQFDTDDALEYLVRIDMGGTIVEASERFQRAIVSGSYNERIEADVVSTLEDTGTTIPATLAIADGKLDTIDSVVDSTLTLLGTVDGKVDTISTAVVTTIPAQNAAIIAALALVAADVTAILLDTGTTIPGQLTGISGQITVVDTVVDLIRVDTLTTIPGLIGGVSTQVTGVSSQVTGVAGQVTVVDTNVDSTLALLIVVDGKVDTIATDTGTTIPAALAVIDANVDALPAMLGAIPGLVWATTLTSFSTTLTSAGDMLNAVRQFATNRLNAIPGNPGTLEWYQDDGSTVRFTMTLNDFTGGAVSGVGGSPALRGPVV